MRSRYQRPPQPEHGLVLQARDLLVLEAVHVHRVMRARHLHDLLFSSASLRACQDRLRRLWEWRFLDRLFLPLVVDGSGRKRPEAGAPIYLLGTRAVPLLKDENIDTHQVKVASLEHRLVVAEFLVALQVACRSCTDVVLDSFAAEALFWRMLEAKQQQRLGVVVPDAVVTLRYPDLGQHLTFYVEVVRADVRGGNRRLLAKMKRYVELNRRGFFRDVYGHQPLRAVIFATPTKARAENLRRVAGELEHGRRLFWFGSYDHLRPSTILTYSWRSVDGNPFTFLTPTSPRYAAPSSPTLPSRVAPGLGRDHVPKAAPPLRPAAA